MLRLEQGCIQEFVQGVAYIFLSFQGGGAQHPLGPEIPLKSIDFTGPRDPPPEYAPGLEHRDPDSCVIMHQFTRPGRPVSFAMH